MHVIGELNLNLTTVGFQEPVAGTKFELVVISAGEIDGTAKKAWEPKEEIPLMHSITLPSDFGWGTFVSNVPFGLISRTNFDTPVPQLIDLYYVLWIEWRDGAAGDWAEF